MRDWTEMFGCGSARIINCMFIIWHTLLITTFIGVAYYLGYTHGKRQVEVKKTIRKS